MGKGGAEELSHILANAGFRQKIFFFFVWAASLLLVCGYSSFSEPKRPRRTSPTHILGKFVLFSLLSFPPFALLCGPPDRYMYFFLCHNVKRAFQEKWEREEMRETWAWAGLDWIELI